jgi:hypothetical protein
VQLNLAAGARRDFFQKLAHAGGIGEDQRRLLGRHVPRKIEIQIDRLFQLAQHLLRAAAQRVELVLRQIQAHAAQSHVRQHHDAQKQNGEQRQTADAHPHFLPTTTVHLFRLLHIEHEGRGGQPKADQRGEIHEVAQVDHSFGYRVKVREEAQ